MCAADNDDKLVARDGLQREAFMRDHRFHKADVGAPIRDGLGDLHAIADRQRQGDAWIGFMEGDKAEAQEAAHEVVRSYRRHMWRYAEMGYTAGFEPAMMAVNAMKDGSGATNPRKLTQPEIEAIYEAAF